MSTLPRLFVIFLTLGCVCSYYYQSYGPSYSSGAKVYHHYVPLQAQESYPAPVIYPSPYGRAPVAPVVPYAAPSHPYPVHAPMMYRSLTPQFAPAASYHQNSYHPYANSFHYQKRPRFSLYKQYDTPYYGAYSHHMPKPSFFSKIKPFLFGGGNNGMGRPQYPYHMHPHHFPPGRPMPINPGLPYHHQQLQYPQQPMPAPYQNAGPERSCSCSLHVGEITVYKHTDMRSSYSCYDLADCKSFCTNLFSSEDLRAQTRADACLLMGRDGSFPWFRRDQVCSPYGVKNDTALSVDLCCKELQAC